MSRLVVIIVSNELVKDPVTLTYTVQQRLYLLHTDVSQILLQSCSLQPDLRTGRSECPAFCLHETILFYFFSEPLCKPTRMAVSVGVLALQGGFLEHLSLLHKSADYLKHSSKFDQKHNFTFVEVRNPQDLAQCDALIIPGGESTTIALIAAQSGLLEPLRDFVK